MYIFENAYIQMLSICYLIDVYVILHLKPK